MNDIFSTKWYMGEGTALGIEVLCTLVYVFVHAAGSDKDRMRVPHIGVSSFCVYH
jgi:hypothetical protein